ncbi:uncharacterized protein [Asterias amurensis]|uniref:uncharacterized protein n=1 Tax=Asterias amurensis TaxID=7602 RepID=UPI003AB87B64
MHLTLLVMSLVVTSWTWVVMVTGTSASDLLEVVPSSISVNSDHEMIISQSLASSKDQRQSSSRKLLSNGSSGVVMATKTSTVLMSTLSGTTSLTTLTGTTSLTTLSGSANPTTLSGTTSPTPRTVTTYPTTLSGTTSPTTLSGTTSPTTLSGTTSPTTLSGSANPMSTTLSGTTSPTLDESYSTRPFRLTMDVIVPEVTDITTDDFISTLELNLALAYTEGKTRRDDREAEIQNLLDKLNPDNDPLLYRRKKRAMTVDGNTAQIVEIARDPTYAVNVVIVFYIAVESGSIQATESKAIFDELTLTELTFYLGVVVETNPIEVIPPDVVMTTPPASGSSYVWIILLVIGLSGFFFLACCCCFCICCRHPVKTSRDGTMDMDTLKMLQHQQKYPYKPYKTPNQTPRGFDVAKETDTNNDAADGLEAGAGSSGMKLQHSSTASALRDQMRDTRLDMEALSSSSESLSSPVHGGPVVPPLQLQNVQDQSPKKSTEDEEDVFHKTVSSLEMSSRSRPSSRNHGGRAQPRLLPLRTRMTQDVDQRSATSSPRSPLTTSREGAELKRLYQAAQNEISQILNPDATSNPPDLIYISPDKRRSKKGKSSKRKRVEKETKFDSEERGQILPDTHYARRSTKQQMTSSKRHPEALNEARRRVHHLIDEAFSLVGLSKNAVSPLATDEATSTADDKLFVMNKDAALGGGSHSTLRDSRTFITEHEDRKQPKKKEEEVADGGTRVLVVPVTHIPDKTSDVVWNPYHAEDELNQLQQSQQLTSSVAGRVDRKPQPDEARHLHMPDPVSVTTHTPEPWMKRLTRKTDQEQTLNQRTTSDGRNIEPFMEQSSRRHVPDLDTSQVDDPYLDPYLKKSSHNDLTASHNLLEYPNAASEEDPYTMRMSRDKKDAVASDPDPKQGDMLSTIAMERRVGKPIKDGYDEIDVSRGAESTNLVAAIRDELIRLAKKTDHS